MSTKEHASYNIKTVQGEGGGVYLNCIQQSLMVEGHAAVLLCVQRSQTVDTRAGSKLDELDPL